MKYRLDLPQLESAADYYSSRARKTNIVVGLENKVENSDFNHSFIDHIVYRSDHTSLVRVDGFKLENEFLSGIKTNKKPLKKYKGNK